MPKNLARAAKQNRNGTEKKNPAITNRTERGSSKNVHGVTFSKQGGLTQQKETSSSRSPMNGAHCSGQDAANSQAYNSNAIRKKPVDRIPLAAAWTE